MVTDTKGVIPPSDVEQAIHIFHVTCQLGHVHNSNVTRNALVGTADLTVQRFNRCKIMALYG